MCQAGWIKLCIWPWEQQNSATAHEISIMCPHLLMKTYYLRIWPGLKASKAQYVLGNAQWRRINVLCFGSINAIMELLGRIYGLFVSCDCTLYPAWGLFFVSGVVEHSSMASGSWKITVGNGSFLSVSTFSLVFSMVWKCWWREETCKLCFRETYNWYMPAN